MPAFEHRDFNAKTWTERSSQVLPNIFGPASTFASGLLMQLDLMRTLPPPKRCHTDERLQG